MLGSLRKMHFGFLISVIVAVLIIGISLDASAQGNDVECPCDFQSVPMTIGCWTDGTMGDPLYIEIDEDTPPKLDCFLMNDTSGTDKFVQLRATDSEQLGEFCTTFVVNDSDCGNINIIHLNLTPAQVLACQCELLAYVTALDNEDNDISVSGGPPYECGNVDCPRPQLINLSPPTATNFVRADHTVTATVDINGVPEPDVLVNFEVISGPNAGEMSDPGNGECSVNDDCTTDGNGQVSWTYSSLIPGTDTILASIGDTDIESNIVEKIWESVPIPTLSGWGMITTAGVLGLLAVIGLFIMRTRRTVAGGRGPDGANQ